MEEGKDQLDVARCTALLERHWRWVVVAAWAIFCAWFVYNRWFDIRTFNLGDTDDNMRISQVRALLHGQNWFDLRQYRLNPPAGANIHWSRLVDLPLAGLILGLRPLIGGPHAELVAVAVAPMLPLLLLLWSLALVVRRLVDRRAYPLAFLALFSGGLTESMFMPERIDHHGWQLALLALSMAGIADPRRRRGGLVLGLSTVLSLAIGLEMIIYLALAGAAMVLFWVDDRDQRDRLAAYAVTLGGGTALGFLAFGSIANRLAMCDALSPVWLSDALLGGALMLGLAWLSPAQRVRRLMLAAGVGLALIAFHALMWPHCLQRLEGVSPEVERLWLSHVREARPVYSHGADAAELILAIPATGAIGWALLTWVRRADRDLLRRIAAAAVPSLAATALLFWQTRTGPAAQMMAIPGAVALLCLLGPALLRSRFVAVRVLGFVTLALIALGAAVPLVMSWVPDKKQTPQDVAVGRANRMCNYIGSYKPIEDQPKGMVFTFVDLGPRLITVTHHDSVAGPYHRNGQQIADVMNAFRGDDRQAHALIAKYRSNYLLTCPDSSTTTIFMSEAPKGFYAHLRDGQVPDWLAPVALPPKSPFKLWRVVG